jgi:hypothetical protein
MMFPIFGPFYSAIFSVAAVNTSLGSHADVPANGVESQNDILYGSDLKIRPFRRNPDEADSQLPPRLLTGSSTRIRQYAEDLRRRLNAGIGRKAFFEMANGFCVSSRCGQVLNSQQTKRCLG